MCQNNPLSMFVTALVCILDPRNATVEYSVAGHPPALRVPAGGAPVFVDDCRGPALGVLPDVAYRNGLLDLDRGDVLVCYTDGVIEAEDPGGALYGDDRLLDLFRDAAPGGADAAADLLRSGLAAFGDGAGLADDVTVVVIGRDPR